jgi:hypothetical protein
MKKMQSIVCAWLVLAAQQMAFAQIDRSWYKTDEEIDKSWEKGSDRGSAAQHRSLESIRKSVHANHDDSESERISYLGGVLRKLAMPNIYQVPERFEVYDLVQSALLRIPGHAQYFADQLAEARKKTEKPWLDNDYRRIRQQTREIMIHLPSPETVRVLGGMLESKEDLWNREQRVAILREQHKKGFGSSMIPSPIGFAGAVLEKIGLRDYPEYPSYKWKQTLPPWWQQVKSGKRTFSFKGQSVEYRFRPDGTWETIPIANPPDDGSKTVPAAPNSEIQTPPSDTIDSVKPDDRSMWWWIAGIAGVLLAVALALLRKFRRAH